MKKLNNICLLIAGIFLFSCNDLIDLKPESVISVNSFWKTEEDAQGGLIGMYNQFRTFVRTDLILLGEARSEVMGNGTANADYRIKYFENSMTQSNADRNWLQLYKIVNFANLVIKYVPGITFKNEATKNAMIAQAYSMRAHVYFMMVRTWGALPVMTEPVEGYDPVTTYKARTPTEEILVFIKSDIDKAHELYANNNFNTTRSLWSKPALNMLKAEVYLWTAKRAKGGTADFTTALAALNEAEQSDLALQSNFADVFAYTNKGNKEIIFASHFADLEASDNYFADMYTSTPTASDGIAPDVIAAIGAGGGNNWWAPTALVRNQFTEDDKRKKGSFLEIYVTRNGATTYSSSIVLKGKGFVTGGVRRFLDDIIIYRYADLLLLKAEAKNALGQDPSPEINKVRQRAYGEAYSKHTFINGSQTANDEAILQERLFELAFEGKRWWDLVRFNKAFEKVPSLKGKDANQYLLLWPLTLQTMSLNSKLEQNPGYN
ncbi:RagB/SusD family nutrient uptake outer membrane protein [Dyadobacter frigoris]|uniref:RagB/SusD family nutrient uptake outer membrane protein n=1 Tax=Dyadobacter frigoris TaxID=2576211 RepID=A0A4V6BKM6_9BACT|nr:RagB/SusD family nutrient uptake outer membrane protein [Dyadobacter frigoris]TKT87943.1 RagB/SusD family nutrient uptake outer membrane protein [Dyadobacter frigoris]